MPKSAISWRIHDVAGRKLGAFSEEGTEVFEWGIPKFTTDWIRKRWGGGEFSAQFFDKEGKARGRRSFRLAAPPARHVSDDSLEAEVVPNAMVPGDPTDRAMKLLGFLDSQAERKAQAAIRLQSDFLTKANETSARLFEAAMGRDREREAARASALPDELRGLLTKIVEGQQALTSRMDDLEADLEDDDEEEEEPRSGNGPSGVAYSETWEGFEDFFHRFVMRHMPTLESKLPELLATIQAKIAELQRPGGAM